MFVPSPRFLVFSLSCTDATIFADYPEHKYKIIENERVESEL
jgi:hypothetical protein